jgi:RNA polymerase sigma-70 factor, ECF subfamily
MDPFEEIYRRYGDSLFRFTCRLVGQRAVAEEITADVFLTLYERIDDIDVTQLPAWLFTVARHRAMDYWRRAAVERRYLSALVAPESQLSPDATSADLFDHRALKPVHRLCLRLRYVYGMTVTEVAAASGLTPMQVKGYLQYARQLLRTQVIEEGK